MASSRTRFHQILFGHLREVRQDLALGALCVLGSSAMALLAPWPLKLLFDQVLLDRPLPPLLSFLGGVLHSGSVTALTVLASALVAIAVMTAFFSYFQEFLTSRIGYRLVYRLRSELFDHLQRLSLSFHSRAHTGELMSNITTDTGTVRDVYSEYLLVLATNLITTCGMFAILVALEWRLGLVILASFPVLFLALLYVLRRVRKSARRERAKEGELASRVSEKLAAVPLVQAFGRERYERERFDEESGHSMEQNIRGARIEAAGGRLVEVATAASSCVVVLVGGLQVLGGHMTPGDLLVFVAYVRSLYRPVRSIARLSTRMARAAASVERIKEVLEIEPEIQDAPDAVPARGLRGEIRFENVTFGYQPGKPVLADVSFTLPAGRHIALVGASGAGKSTLANLVIRLCDPWEGRVLIDGVDVRRYRRESLRHEVGVVLQDSILFGTTIRENITYGKPDATDEEVIRAAREVHAHEFISALPNGYGELLGEGGATLSGGQRQRLCLARALIKRPSILIMDEPTSAVDADSAALIRDAMQHVQQGKTMLLIAHQLYSVQDADHIVVLKDGRIVEQGTHAELVARGGHYCELFRLVEVAAYAA